MLRAFRLWVCVLLLLPLMAWPARAQRPPELRIESLSGGAGDEARLARVRADQLTSIMRIAGLEDAGEPIRVVLAPEASDVAQATPSWIAGFADAQSGTVVLFPSRSPRYPHDSLEDVLYHEVAHVLIARAAGGYAVPRWFNEGLATVAERPWHFGDRWELAWAVARGIPVELDRLDPMFQQGPPQANRAYALASAFVRHLIDSHGVQTPGRVLALRAGGVPFDEAFARTTGMSRREAERRFARSLRSWERWVPALTNPLVLWMAVSLLAVYAMAVARRRRAERRRRWDEEEGAGADAEGPPGGVVH